MQHEFSFVPGFEAALEGAHEARTAHAQLSDSLDGGSLGRRQRLLVALAVAQASQSAYCRWVHTCAARAAGISGEDMALACAGTALDRRECTIVRLAARVSRGGRIDFCADHFRDVSLAPTEIRDVMAQVALTLLEDFILRNLDPEAKAHGAPA
jgi:AhpD family alkylhydroperoxidase